MKIGIPKGISKKLILGAVSVFMLSTPVYAQLGDMFFAGGISEGERLPKTTKVLVDATKTNTNANNTRTFVYKETLFQSGIPNEFEGRLTIRTQGKISDTDKVGKYTETYTVGPTDTTPDGVNITRTAVFNVNYRKEGNQIIKDYETTRWTETIETQQGTFILDPVQSRFTVSVIEDHTAGVVYYKGNTSQRAVYTLEDTTDKTTLETSGSFYGYKTAWSATEAHRLDGTVITDNWQMQYQVRPSVSVNKTLQYSKNEPTAMSFDGNYREVMQNLSGLSYDIFVKPQQFYNIPDKGTSNIPSYNDFEQLIAPDVAFLKGHFAEEDIRKLFSMQVLEGDPKFYQPSQAITRGQFVAALVKAVKLPVEELPAPARGKKTATIPVVFPDVLPERPEYPQIMAAYKNGLAIGRSNGYFYFDSPITRQEAIVIMLRTLGLENLGLDPTPNTGFSDDSKIAGWAKREISAAKKIGLIAGDTDGNFKPLTNVSKAEAAALLNRLINYMRTDIARDYEYMVNYSD